MLRLGAVSYLNTKPLIQTLPERLAEQGLDASLRLDLPSRLAADLSAGKLDVALIPSIEFFRGRPLGYEIVSDAAIGCRGPVWSVRLLSRVPTREIRTLALDEGSRTSAAMVQVLLSEMHGLRPQTVPFPIHSDVESIDADAVLMIGDRAMHPDRGVYREIWDLGDRWCRSTELPFVFAMWVARRDVLRDGDVRDRLAAALQTARDDGAELFEHIAVDHAASQGLTNEDLHRYFAENLHFHLGPRESAGLSLFGQKAAELGLLETSPSAADSRPLDSRPFDSRPIDTHPV